MTLRVLLGCAPAIAGSFDFGFMALAAPAVSLDVAAGGAHPWLFSAGSIAYGAAVMPAGALSERIGAGRVLAGGFLSAAVGMATVAVSGDVEWALLGRALFGFGGGATAAPALILLAEVEIVRLRRLAFALMGGGIALGFSAGVLAEALLAGPLGWRAIMACVALLLGLLGAVAAARSTSIAPATVTPATGALLLGAATVAAGGCLASAASAPRVALLWMAVAVALAAAGLRNARRMPLAVYLAGAAITASGVGATVLIGRLAASSPGASHLLLGCFGLAALPAIRLSRAAAARLGAAGSATLGLAIQGAVLAALGLLLAGPAVPTALIAPIALFGAGHVVANAGIAAAAVGSGCSNPTPLAGLLITSQYLGAGVGPQLTLAGADVVGASTGMLIAASIALAGAAVLAFAPVERRDPVRP